MLGRVRTGATGDRLCCRARAVPRDAPRRALSSIELERARRRAGLLRPHLLRATSSPRTACPRASRSATCRATTAPARCAACTTTPRPHGEAKLVRCVAGRDLRRDRRPARRSRRRACAGSASSSRPTTGARCSSRRASPTASSRSRDDTDVYYHMGAFYEPDAARGLRWDDPRFGIDWPVDAGGRSPTRDAHLPRPRSGDGCRWRDAP